MNLTKITGTDCIVLISNILMQILNYDSTVKHAISTTNNYRIIRFSQSHSYLW